MDTSCSDVLLFMVLCVVPSLEELCTLC
jgi:hypothetical protein